MQYKCKVILHMYLMMWQNIIGYTYKIILH